jgi:hypothetical protein
LYERHTQQSVLARVRYWKTKDVLKYTSSTDFVSTFVRELDRDKMWHTVNTMDVDQPLAPTQTVTGDTARYNPSFFVPLVANLVTICQPHDVRLLIESNLISVTIAALSSTDEPMRLMAHYTLHGFHTLAKQATFYEQPQVLLLLDWLKSSIPNKTDRLYSIASAFVVHALGILLRPAHHMYLPINRYLLAHPTADLTDIPMFLNIINSNSANSVRERVWFVGLLASGMRTRLDVLPYKRRHIVELLCNLYTAPFSSSPLRAAISKTMHALCQVDQVRQDAVYQHGLIAWIHGVVHGWDEHAPMWIQLARDVLVQDDEYASIVYYQYENLLLSMMSAPPELQDMGKAIRDRLMVHAHRESDKHATYVPIGINLH